MSRGTAKLRFIEDDAHVSTFRNPSNHSDSNTFDAQGLSAFREHLGRRVVRHEHDGRVTVIASAYNG